MDAALPIVQNSRSCQPCVFFFNPPPPGIIRDGSCSSRSLVHVEGRISASKIISSSIASDRKQQTTVRAPSAMTPLTYLRAYIVIIICAPIPIYYITVVRSRKTSVEYYYTPVIFFLLPGFIVCILVGDNTIILL